MKVVKKPIASFPLKPLEKKLARNKSLDKYHT